MRNTDGALEQQLRNWLDVVNERAVALRDKIGQGEHMRPIQSDLQCIIDLSREHRRFRDRSALSK